MTGVSKTLITVIVCLIIIGSIFLVYTNSRSSILIKEQIAVGGSALVLIVAAFSLATGVKISLNRLNLPICISFLLLTGWMVFRYYTGTGSVNGPKIIFSLIALCGLVTVLALTFTESSRDTVLWILAGSTTLLCIYAVLQSLGIILLPWDSGLIQQARSSGTMGNANLLGSFSAAMLPVGFGFLLGRNRMGKLRILLAIIFAIICTGAIIASKTRGSLIGIFAVAVLAPFIPVFRKNRRRLLLVLALLFVLIAGSVFFMQNRIEELTDTEAGGTFQVRKLIWSGTLSMIAANPVTGWGPGSFQIVFPQFRNPEYFILGVSHNTLHAHCEYLEILVDIGAIGLILWGAVAVFLGRILYRNRFIFSTSSEQQKPDCVNWTVLGLLGGVIALLAEATVSVALRWPPSALLLAVLCGLLLASIPPDWKLLKGTMKTGSIIIFVLAAVFLGCMAFPHYMVSMKSGRQLFVGRDLYLSKIQSTLNEAVNAAANWTHSGNDGDMERALYYYDMATQISDSSISWCKNCIETNPDELGGWYALGSTYVSRALIHKPLSGPMVTILQMNGRIPFDQCESERYVRLGLAAYDSLMKRAPYYAEVHNNLALIWTNLGMPDNALASIRTAWELHAHRRPDYFMQSMLLAPFTEGTDAYHIRWVTCLNVSKELMERTSSTNQRRYLQRVFFFTGTCFLNNPDLSDSLFNAFIDLADEFTPSRTSVVREGMELQIRELEKGLDIIRRLERGDTTGILLELQLLNPEEIEILPAQMTALGLLLTQRNDFEGMVIYNNALKLLLNNCCSITEWPVSGTRIISEINSALLACSLKTVNQRDLFIETEMDALYLDRQIFRVMHFMNTSPGFTENVPGYIQDSLMELWEDLGGPLYCYSNKSQDQDDDSPYVSVLLRHESVLGRAYAGLLQLETENQDDPELIKLEIAWFYTIYLSFYSDDPYFTVEQSYYVLNRLRSAREKLVCLLGEMETVYQIGRMLDRMPTISGVFSDPQFGQYAECLRNDLVTGSI